MKIKEINLKDTLVRKEYSDKLKNFENEFIYPLGTSSFQIRHGHSSDYFTFFDQMGETHYFTIEDKNKIVGAGCAVLRTSDDNKKYWYLCDFKITKEYRGKNLLEKMFAKYFLKYIIKSHRFMAVNMGESDIKENKLVAKIQKMFWFFNIDIKWMNFHQWSKDDLKKENINIANVYTNLGKKDIVINNEPWQLYHIASPSSSLNKFSQIGISSLRNNDTVMCCVEAKKDTYSKSSISGRGVIISSGMKSVKISSLEI